MLKVGHSVDRPGRRHGDNDVKITVPEELETEPGIVQLRSEVDFYSREYPLESQQIEYTADREWVWTVYKEDQLADRRIHDVLNKPIVEAAKDSGDIQPSVEPNYAKDVTEEIRLKARELGFSEAGFTAYDMRYAFSSKREWIKYPHALCLAWEQDYEPTQTAPSLFAEGPHHSVYRIMGAVALDLAEHIRSLGYHAQIHSPNDNSGVYIPMFVAAGLGQLGANGQLLSPHFGSRARLMIITTDAVVTHDQPIDYGLHAFCSICQVCVNRCPGRALMRDKVWWRGVQKHKLIYKRCRPVMARYDGCAVCMKTCPVQRYGVPAVMDHYVATGQVLGKGTHLLEGYSIREMGYFGPGELPSFGRAFFDIPHGKSEDVLFEDLKEKISGGEVSSDTDGVAVLQEFKDKVSQYISIAKSGVTMEAPGGVEEA